MREKLSRRQTVHGFARKGRQTAEFNAWMSMRRRCTKPSAHNFKNYGGRGIAVCDRWLYGESGASPFQCFLADMGCRPTDQHTLERRDTNGNYTTENCEWLPAKLQSRNRRNVRRVLVDGYEMLIGEACSRFGINHASVRHRISKGWDPEVAISTPFQPPKKKHQIEVAGTAMTLAEAARHYGIAATTVHYRLHLGWTLDDALTKPIMAR